MDTTTYTDLLALGHTTIDKLKTPEGLLASSKEGAYGALFGRDSLLSACRLLAAHSVSPDEGSLDTVRRILSSLSRLLGEVSNPLTGEEPGKVIHEYRTEGYEHLRDIGWYIYPDGTLKNYDSVDATPLFLITAHEYLERTNDTIFIASIDGAIRKALSWILDMGDANGDGLIDYTYPKTRVSGGTRVQNWMDSQESLFNQDLVYPIANVEVQGYAYAALKRWAYTLKDNDPILCARLNERATKLRDAFRTHFMVNSNKGLTIANTINGAGVIDESFRTTQGHLLWSAWRSPEAGSWEMLLEEHEIAPLIERLMQDDMFVSGAGLRTLSSTHQYFNPDTYHDGSIWPHDTSLVAEGMDRFGYNKEALRVREAYLSAIKTFGSPMELYTFADGSLRECLPPTGHRACREQAWCAASLIYDALVLLHDGKSTISA